MRDAKQIHNPLVRLPAAQRLQQLPPAARQALKALLLDLRRDAADKAQAAWARNKGMMAAYWKVVSIYAGHTARLCRDPHPSLPQQRLTGEAGAQSRGRETRETRDGLKAEREAFGRPSWRNRHDESKAQTGSGAASPDSLSQTGPVPGQRPAHL